MKKPPLPFKEERTASLLKDIVADWIQRESNGKSMITVTGIRHLGRKIVFLCSVLPEEQSPVALEFLKRKRSEIHEYAKGKTRMYGLPMVDFEIDDRQSILS